jgi:hypothetical protein
MARFAEGVTYNHPLPRDYAAKPLAPMRVACGKHTRIYRSTSWERHWWATVGSPLNGGVSVVGRSRTATLLLSKYQRLDSPCAVCLSDKTQGLSVSPMTALSMSSKSPGHRSLMRRVFA